MKNVWTIIAVACIIAGCVIGHFSTIAIADYGAIALEAFGFCTLIVNTLKKAKEKTWKEYSCIALFALAGVFCALAGVEESTMTQLISVVTGLIALIAGLFVSQIKKV